MKIVLVCGSAECLFDDLARMKELLDVAYDVACINHTALYYPYFFNYWIGWHPEIFAGLRKFVKGNPITMSSQKEEGVDSVWNFNGFYASDSSLYAAKIMLELKYDRVILCGSPMDNSRKFYEPYGAEKPQHSADNIQEAWRQEVAGFKDRVKSMSGNTRHILGAPTKEWLHV